MAGRAARLVRIDVLRGCAVFGILLINVWGFVHGYTSYRYGVADAATDWTDQAVVFFAASFAEQKFYPIFAFLFGAGFALRWRERPQAWFSAEYRNRLRWLLRCGVLHGTLLWLGDILTGYALAGRWLLANASGRLRSLMPKLRMVLIVNLIVLAVIAALEMMTLPVDEMVGEALVAREVYTLGGWSDIALARLRDYTVNLFSLLFFLPRIVLLFLLGVVAVRLGWLIRPLRHRAAWLCVLQWGMGIGIPINLWWGYVSMRSMSDPYNLPAGSSVASALIEVGGPILAAGYIAAVILAPQALIGRLAPWLAPVGRMALTNYLMQSLLLMVLLQGFGLGLGAQLSRVGLLQLCVGIMLFQLLLSRWWLAGKRQGPMEAIWRRYTEQSAHADGKIAG